MALNTKNKFERKSKKCKLLIEELIITEFVIIALASFAIFETYSVII